MNRSHAPWLPPPSARPDPTFPDPLDEDLRNRCRMLDSLLAHAPAALIAYDERGRVEHWNPAAERIFGWRAEEVLGRQPPMVQPGQRSAFFEVLHRTLLGEAIGERDARRVRKDGLEVDIRIWTAPLPDGNGRIRGMIAFIVDITDRLRTLDALSRETEAKHDLLEAARTARVVPWSQKMAGGPIHLGDSALEVLGIPGGEYRLDTALFLEVLHPEDLRTLRRVTRAALHGQVGSFECRMRRPDGRWISSRWTLGQREGRLQGVIQDMDAFVELQRQFFASQKLENLGRVAGGLAHDFKNLLGAILGYADFLSQDAALTASQKHGLEVILRSAEQGNRLITQLLGMSRPLESQRTLLNLNDTLQEVAELLPAALGPGIHLDLEPRDPLPRVLADPGQIHQVVMNLALNARDALGTRGRIALRTGVEGEPSPEAPGHAFLEIEDDGAGMTQEVLDRVYEPFFTTKDPGVGTGLGLAVVKAIVAKHQGRIHLHSTPGKGTRFRIAFPIHDPLGRAPA